jgi:hypothetical protein
VARGAAAAVASAEADQNGGGNDQQPACRHLWLRQRMAEQADYDRRDNEARDKGESPNFVAGRHRQSAA